MIRPRHFLALLPLVIACGCGGGSPVGPSPTPPSPTPPAPTPETRVVGLSGSLAFGNVQVGKTATATLTISNSGTGALTVNGISYPAGFNGDFSSGTIAAGGTKAVNVAFAPTAASSYSGTVTVDGNQTAGTNSMAVSGAGMGVPAPPTPNPPTPNPPTPAPPTPAPPAPCRRLPLRRLRCRRLRYHRR